MNWRIGIDIGGTFTDFALLDAAGERLAVHKQLTTPRDPSEAVIDGVAAILDANDVPISEISSIAHGTTLVTNAVIERRGAVTGMLVTKGFGDIMDMGMERRYDLFDLGVAYPEPLVSRTLRRGIPERVHYDGRIETPLDLAAARTAIAELAEAEELTAPEIRNMDLQTPREGIGVVEAPRGTLIHHYETDERGVIQAANLLVATLFNSAPICMSVEKAAKKLIHGGEVSDGLLNQVEMAFRAYDPCFSCATHTLPGQMPLEVVLRDRAGEVVGRVTRTTGGGERVERP